jgi:adenylosuccinate synthase
LALPVHKAIDAAAEAAKGDAKVGTTLRGIGPTYVDKASRTGIRCGELRDFAGFVAKLRAHLALTNRQLAALGAPALDEAKAIDAILPACQRIAPLVADTEALLSEAFAAGKHFMFEGAQGVMLDIDYGTYPFVTSSNTGVGGVITGSGLSHKAMGEVIGVAKAYCTRVGSGPFPSELTCAIGEHIRKTGGEYGATTGRPRRTGWFDAVAVRFACRVNGVDAIALTKLDILTGQKDIPVCVAYELDGKRIATIPARIEDFARVTPVYETFPGWTESIAACRTVESLPATARAYIQALERIVGVPVKWIGVGPGRDETIVR